jgi:hypothetical protein
MRKYCNKFDLEVLTNLDLFSFPNDEKLFVGMYKYIFWGVGGLERGPLSLVITIEELLEKEVAAPV